MSPLLLVGAGLALLFFGGDLLVRGAMALAARLGVPATLIGLTVVGFGTSMPELVVSVDAALRGTPDIALGNVVGSNTANVLLIVGLAALVWPIRTAGLSLGRDLLAMLAASAALLPLFWIGTVTRGAGAALVAALALYLAQSIRAARAEPDAEPLRTVSLPKSGLLTLAGLAMLIVGARALVSGAVEIARDLGVSEAFIGLTVVAVGTSLPELATSLVAALRRQSAIALGNVVGSNLFNVLGILGVTALIAPVPVATRFLTIDLPVMAGAGLALALLMQRPSIGRGTGIMLLAAYAAYVVFAVS